MSWVLVAAAALVLLAGTFLLVVLLGVHLMATLGDVNASLALQTQAIADLAGRIPVPQGPPVATEADLDTVKAAIDTNTATVAALAPPVV